MPFFSVIIPLFNKEKYIANTLNSVLSQNFTDYEIIIINDGSTDNSLSVISYFKDSSITIINQPNKGVSAARNKGIKVSKGEYIAFLDGDDLWKKDHLKKVYNATTLFPEKKVFCSNYEVIFSKNNITKTQFSVNITEEYSIIEDYFKSSLKSSIALTSAVTIKKDTLINYNFNESIKSGQDTDLWIQLALVTNFVFIKKVTVSHYKSIHDSLSKSRLIDHRLYAINNHIDAEKNNPSLNIYLDYNRYSIAQQYKRNKEFVKYHKLIKSINTSNLPIKKRILLKLPALLILFLDKINKTL